MRVSTGTQRGALTTAIILAGGEGRRLGLLKSVAPKALLPARGGSILERLIAQLVSTTVRDIVICTSPEHASAVAVATSQHYGENGRLWTVTSPSFRNGPIDALTHTVDILATEHVLLVLGDIVFRDNPFHSFPLADPSRMEIYLGATLRPDTFCIRYGQVVDTSSGIRLVEEPNPSPLGGWQWSGLALFPRRSFQKALARHLPVRALRLGDVFNRLANHHRLHGVPVPPFVNVNTLDDYLQAQFLISESKCRKIASSTASIVMRPEGKKCRP
jgi:NDP-sugar pyrophosphorylase family protein